MKTKLLIPIAIFALIGCEEKESKVNNDCLDNPYITLAITAPGATVPPSGRIALATRQNFRTQVSWRILPDDGKIKLLESFQQDTTSKATVATTSALTVGASYTFIATAGMEGGYCPLEDSVTVSVIDGHTTSDCGDGLGMRIRSTCWATANVDDSGKFATRPDMYTKFYQWNKGKAWSATGDVTGWTTPVYYYSEVYGRIPCPEGWHTPTRAEYEALFNAGSTWVDANTRGNAVPGRFYGENHATCSLPDNMVGCVFLPSAGGRYSSNGELVMQGVNGGYWSSTAGGRVSEALAFTFGSNSIDVWNSIRTTSVAVGYSIRCVRN